MKKRAFSLFMAALLAVSMLTACGGEKEPSGNPAGTPGESGQTGTEDTGDKLVLTWQSWDPVSKYQPVLDAYKEVNPDVVINYEQISDYETKINTEAAGDALPDLLSCKVGNTQMFAEAGILEEINPEELKADASYNFGDFWETTLDYATYKGKMYGIPVDGGNYAWVYNKKIFEKLDLEVPEEGYTWDEFLDTCKLIMEHKEETGVNYATLINDYGIKTLLPYMWQNGVEYTNGDDTVSNLDAPQTVEAVKYIQELVDAGVIPPIEKLDEGSFPIVGMLNSGAIAMGRVALWEALKLEDSETLDWGIMHAPRGNDGTKGEVLYVNTISISSTSENKEAAMDFIKFATSEEGLRILLENTTDPQIAVRKSLKDVSVSQFAAEKNAGIFVDALEYCKWMPNVLTVNEQMDAASRQLDRIWYSGEDEETVLEDLAAEVNELLKK